MRIPGLWRIKNRIIDAEMYFLQGKLDLEPDQHILLFSDPRGGSTWMSEILSKITLRPVLWEPLHLTSVKEFDQLKFSWRQHISDDERWDEAKETFDKLFSGEILNHWISMYTTKNELKASSSTVIKFCRANAMIPWLVQNYSFKHKPVHLLRHPFAVVMSQIKMGWNFGLDKLINDRPIHNAYYAPHLDYLKSLKTNEEGLTAFWCLSNKYTLEHEMRKTKWITMFYEDLLLDPEAEINKLMQLWGIDHDLNNIDFTKASSTASQKDAFSAESQIRNWKNALDKESVQKMQNVLDYFKIEVYSSEVYPHK